jgi:thiomorpholine-carboxylate dehydrogenase
VRALTDVRVWSPTREHAERFAREHGVRACASAEEAVRGAQLVVAATSSPQAVVRGAWVERGAHVTTVGASRPAWRELDDDTMHAGPVFVDSRAAAVVESGDVIQSKASIYAEAGELFGGIVAAPPPGTTTIFKSLGLAVEDVVSAALVAGSSG